MSLKTFVRKKHIMLTAVFTVYMSEYMICLICMDQNGYALADTGKIFHYIKMPALAAGFLLFPLSRRLCTGIRARRIVLLISNIIFMAGMSAVIFIKDPGPAVYLISCVTSLLSLGFLGGCVYYCYAMGLTGHPCLGRLAGFGGALAFLLQMLVMYVVPADISMLLLLLTGFAFTAYVTLAPGKTLDQCCTGGFEWMFDEPPEYAEKGDPNIPGLSVIAGGTVAMMLLYMICGLTDTVLVSMNFAGEMGIYAWPRLFGAVGYLLGGFLADLGRRKWLPLCALCLTILCIPLPFMLREGHLILGICLYYVIVVGQIGFLNVFFWELAPKTSYPELTAGLSRVLSCLVVTILPVFSDSSAITGMITETVLAAVTILIIALAGYLPPISRSAPGTKGLIPAAATAGTVDHLESFAEQHGLTPREKDFLVLLLESDDEVSVIASKMNISTRTVYRHINSIYEKTGTETRYALMRYYYKTKES